jgi:LmbE family N-acetylglucosaminyl deacetylase
MPTTENARRSLLRRTVIILLILAAIPALAAMVLHLTIPLRATASPPVASDVAIIVSPHPDDETYAMGQTIATQDIEGVHTIAVLVTDGDSSVHVDWWREEHGCDVDGDGDQDRWDFGLARRAEYENALEILGADEVIFLGGADSQGASGFRDTEVDADQLADALSEIARDNPGADWFTIAPYASERWYAGDYKNHPDHGEVARAVATAARENDGDAYYFKVYTYYLRPFARFAPVRVQGTDEARERKRQAVEAFSVIGAKSTPELYDATRLDPAEYLVTDPPFPESD